MNDVDLVRKCPKFKNKYMKTDYYSNFLFY